MTNLYRQQYNMLIHERFEMMGKPVNPDKLAELKLKILTLDRLATEEVNKVILKLKK